MTLPNAPVLVRILLVIALYLLYSNWFMFSISIRDRVVPLFLNGVILPLTVVGVLTLGLIVCVY